MENFFDIPVNKSENLIFELADGLEHLFKEYITFVTSCGKELTILIHCMFGTHY